jgi:hypothetical protein
MENTEYANTRKLCLELLRERLATKKIRSMEMKQLLELEREIEEEAPRKGEPLPELSEDLPFQSEVSVVE